MAKDTDVLQAVRDQDAQALERILCKNKNKLRLGSTSKKLNVNYQDEDGMSALHQAALQGNVDCMRLLLEHGASPDIKDNKGMRPVHYAAWQGLLEPVTLLLSNDASPKDAADDGDTPLHFASQHGHLEVVTLLLQRGADPTVRNHNKKTSLDLACEFGRYRVAEHLILSGLCDGLLCDLGGKDLADHTRTTCLHLAARNGHTDIITLLLQADVDINHQTAQGTALHEAALYGKTNVVRLLIERGIDINLPNSFDQTALDIVNKFTKKAGAKELKALLTDASTAFRARAIKDYSNPYDSQSLTLRVGDIVTVLEQRADGISRGFLTNSGSLTRAALFPSNCVTAIDVPAPRDAVASGDRQVNCRGSGSGSWGPQTDGSGAVLYGSFAVADDGTPIISPPPLYRAPDAASSHYQFPPPISPLSATAAAPPDGRLPQAFFDQASIGRHSVSSRDSRGSLSHYSCGSGSGSVQSSYVHHALMQQQQQQQQRLSGQGCDPVFVTPNGGAASFLSAPSQHVASTRQSVNSVGSSCCSSSLGDSAERLLESVAAVGGGESSGYSSGSINIVELFMQGLSDADVLYTWLSELHFEGYCECFLDAGYDMATISRMTPEDLTAIGITKPAHRRRLKAEISRLNITDGIPDYKPASVVEWLHMLRLEQYLPALRDARIDSIEKVTEIIWEDLEAFGIQKLGHQKKIMLAIEKLKRACKRQSTASGQSACSGGYSTCSSPADTLSGIGTASHSLIAANGAHSRWSADMASADGGSLPRSHHSVRPSQQLTAAAAPMHVPRACSQPSDIVAITVKTGMSRSSSGNSVNSAGEYAQSRCKSFAGTDRYACVVDASGGAASCIGSTGATTAAAAAGQAVACYDDSSSSSSSGGGSLPRGSTGGTGNGRGPLRAIHGMPMAKAAGSSLTAWNGDGNSSSTGNGLYQHWDGNGISSAALEGVSQYATLRRRQPNSRPSVFSTASASAVPCELTLPAALRQGSPVAGCSSDAGASGFVRPGSSSMPFAVAGPPSPGLASSGGGTGCGSSGSSMTSPFANFKSPYAHIQTGQVRNVMSMSASGRVEWAGAGLSPPPAELIERTVLPAAVQQQQQQQQPAQPQQAGKKPPPPPRRSNSLSSKPVLPHAESEKRDDADSGICLAAAVPPGDTSRLGSGSVSPAPSEQDSVDAVAFPPPPPPMAFDIQHMKAAHKGQQQQHAAAAAVAASPAVVATTGTAATASSSASSQRWPGASGQIGDDGALAATAAPQPPAALSAVLQSNLAVRRRAAASAISSSSPSAWSNPAPASTVVASADDPSSSERRDSSCSASSRSSGAGDAAFLPFANENVGTIRQRPAGSTSSGVGLAPPGSCAEHSLRLAARPVGQVQPVVFGGEQRAQDAVSAHTQMLPAATDGVALATASGSKPIAGGRDVFSELDSELQSLTHELELELENITHETTKPH